MGYTTTRKMNDKSIFVVIVVEYQPFALHVNQEVGKSEA